MKNLVKTVLLISLISCLAGCGGNSNTSELSNTETHINEETQNNGEFETTKNPYMDYSDLTKEQIKEIEEQGKKDLAALKKSIENGDIIYDGNSLSRPENVGLSEAKLDQTKVDNKPENNITESADNQKSRILVGIEYKGSVDCTITDSNWDAEYARLIKDPTHHEGEVIKLSGTFYFSKSGYSTIKGLSDQEIKIHCFDYPLSGNDVTVIGYLVPFRPSDDTSIDFYIDCVNISTQER